MNVTLWLAIDAQVKRFVICDCFNMDLLTIVIYHPPIKAVSPLIGLLVQLISSKPKI